MAHDPVGIRAHESFALPRGIIVACLALSSWALAIALWNALSAGFSFVAGL